MIHSHRLIPLALLVALAACAPAPETIASDQPGAGTPISECQRLDRPGHYSLSTDLSGAPLEVSAPPLMMEAYTGETTLTHACLEVTSSQVSLDCQGHALSGPNADTGTSAGIYMASSEGPLIDVEVSGCLVSGYQMGVYAAGLEGGALEDIESRRNTGIGLYVVDSSGVTLSENTVVGNDPDGILIVGSREITIADNEVSYNRMRGITFEGCQECTVSGNESFGHGVLGFALYGSQQIRLQNNLAYDNRYHGFAILHEAGSATFEDNESYNNGSTGYFLQDSTGNRYLNNLSRDNTLDGIAAFGQSTGNSFEGNTFRDNGGYGALADEAIDEIDFTDSTFEDNALGDIGRIAFADVDTCIYMGFGPQGPCDPVFEGGPNLNDPGSAGQMAPTAAGEAVPTPTGGQVIVDAQIVGAPIAFPAFGDLWMPTWADDDRLYLSWGDGTGFGDGYPSLYPEYHSTEPIVISSCGDEYFPCQLWCSVFSCQAEFDYPPAPLTDAGVLAATGPVPDLEPFSIASIDVPTGEPFFVAGPGGALDVAGRNDKPSSLLFVDGRLYLAGHDSPGTPTLGYLAYSEDGGVSWTEIPGSPWGETSVFRVLMFINMGQAYDLNEDGYIYGFGVGSDAQGEAGWPQATVYLTRVRREQVGDYAAYEYFTGQDAGGPGWSPDQAEAAPVEGVHTTGQASAMYHQGTGRYLFLTTDSGQEATPTNSGALYEAAAPWGPWHMVAVLCFVQECNDGGLDPAWTDGKYIAGLIPKGAGPDFVYFTVAGGDEHYQLQVGRLELMTRR